MLKNRKIQLLILIVLLIIVTTFFIIKNVIYKPKAKNSKEQYNNIKSNNIETTNVVEKSVISKEDLLKNINYAEKEIKEDELLNKLKNLEIYAIEFKEENNVNTSIVELCLQYIRKDKYNSDAWKITAGNINEEFVKYVNEKSKELSNYNFQNAKIPNWNFHLSWFCAIMLFWHLSLPGAQLCGGQGGYKNRNRKEDYPNETQHHHPSVQPGRCRCSGCELHRPDRLRQQRIFCCFQHRFYRFYRCIRCCRRRQLLRRERDLDPGRRHPDHQRHRPYDQLYLRQPGTLGRPGRPDHQCGSGRHCHQHRRRRLQGLHQPDHREHR